MKIIFYIIIQLSQLSSSLCLYNVGPEKALELMGEALGRELLKGKKVYQDGNIVHVVSTGNF